MKKSGLKNEQFISELIVSGSTAIKTKNDFGVHIFSGSVLDDGVISSKLVKPKYNQAEILKSLDTTIIELIPIALPDLEDTVLRSIYNVALRQIDDLTNEVSILNDVVLSLESKITELEIVSESLRVEIDGDKILIASLQNQNQQSSDRISSTILDLQNSIQRATSEAVARVSLTARNESLLQETESLRTELKETRERLDQSIKDLIRQNTIDDARQRGAVGNADLLATPTIEEPNAPAIAWRGKPKNFLSSNYNELFFNGRSIDLFNPTDTTVTVNITYSGFETGKRFFGNIPQITVPPKGRNVVKLIPNISLINSDLRKGKDTNYDGTFTFRTSNGTFSIDAAIQIQRGDKFSA
jgi:hypothetical protein